MNEAEKMVESLIYDLRGMGLGQDADLVQNLTDLIEAQAAEIERLTAERDKAVLAVRRLHQLRNNTIKTQRCGWSNFTYPVVAILTAYGLDYDEAAATDEQIEAHLNCYGGAGNFPEVTP